MKKKVGKLTLSRETLGFLDDVRNVVGGTASVVCTRTHPCTLTCGIRCVSDASDPCTAGTSLCTEP
jgi:hypothetical protein